MGKELKGVVVIFGCVIALMIVVGAFAIIGQMMTGGGC